MKEKIWIVRTEDTYDGMSDLELKAFSTFEKAEKYFNECVSKIKEDEDVMNKENKVIEEYGNHFAIWQDDYYYEDRHEIEIIEKKVH